ncbi:hypothetical protein [Nocardia abscessus]|nr:hypothetical protein [Nocardia abscessus]
MTIVTPPRAGHHRQDNARAWLLVGKTDQSPAALNKARLRSATTDAATP